MDVSRFVARLDELFPLFLLVAGAWLALGPQAAGWLLIAVGLVALFGRLPKAGA